MIPFSPPRIDQPIIDAVTETLKSGWITTGPKCKAFEEALKVYAGVAEVLTVNSCTAGLELMLRWLGVGEGDEVIVPAYTYAATANVVIHCGAKPVMVDIEDDFNIDPKAVARAITKHTKAIIPVDFGGRPCAYQLLWDIITDPNTRRLFHPANEIQRKLGRIMLLADAAHSLGATYQNRSAASWADAAVYSFHAVKNLTTAEGGAICLNLPEQLDNSALYAMLRIMSLHGQTKDALAKFGQSGWEYDIVAAGYKCNMPDILAAMGLVELERYASETLPKREKIFEWYNDALAPYSWAQLPAASGTHWRSSCHLYPLRIKTVSVDQRNAIITQLADQGISTNVHFKPLPLMQFYHRLGYEIGDYPQALNAYKREISLPVFYDLTQEQAGQVTDALIAAVG